MDGTGTGHRDDADDRHHQKDGRLAEQRAMADVTAGGARRPAGSLTWMSRGACQAEDPELFFPIAAHGPALSQISAARAVCQRCAVAALCLAYALETGQAGIWGGTTQEERIAMTERHRRKPAAPAAPENALTRG